MQFLKDTIESSVEWIRRNLAAWSKSHSKRKSDASANASKQEDAKPGEQTNSSAAFEIKGEAATNESPIAATTDQTTAISENIRRGDSNSRNALKPHKAKGRNKRRIFLGICLAGSLAVCVSSCSFTRSLFSFGPSHSHKRHHVSRNVKPVRITHIPQREGFYRLRERALDLMGTPYRYGGSDDERGFDCSGFTQHLFKRALNVNIPRTSRDQAAASMSVSKRNLMPGDLVFFGSKGRINHVGLYLGDNSFIHSPNSKSHIKINAMDDHYWRDHFIQGGRYFR